MIPSGCIKGTYPIAAAPHWGSAAPAPPQQSLGNNNGWHNPKTNGGAPKPMVR